MRQKLEYWTLSNAVKEKKNVLNEIWNGEWLDTFLKQRFRNLECGIIKSLKYTQNLKLRFILKERLYT